MTLQTDGNQKIAEVQSNPIHQKNLTRLRIDLHTKHIKFALKYVSYHSETC